MYHHRLIKTVTYDINELYSDTVDRTGQWWSLTGQWQSPTGQWRSITGQWWALTNQSWSLTGQWWSAVEQSGQELLMSMAHSPLK